jgi:hypothetical protein
VLVRRTVNGATVRYIEIFDDTFEPLLPGSAPTGYPPYTDPVTYGYTVDCGASFDNAGGQSTFSVPHLIGCTVDIVADGCGDAAAGGAGLGQRDDRPRFQAHADRPALRVRGGPAHPGDRHRHRQRAGQQHAHQRGHDALPEHLGAKMLDGDGVEQDVPFRQFGAGILDASPQPFTGVVRIETLGWERGRSEFTIVQDQPLPMHLLSVVRKFQVND